MARSDAPFVVHVVDLLRDFAPVKARAMFGGHGLYRDGVMFALIADGVLYVKADDANRDVFEAEGLEKFTYSKQGRMFTISYYTVPEAAMEDPEVLARWASEGFAAARRAHEGT